MEWGWSMILWTPVGPFKRYSKHFSLFPQKLNENKAFSYWTNRCFIKHGTLKYSERPLISSEREKERCSDSHWWAQSGSAPKNFELERIFLLLFVLKLKSFTTILRHKNEGEKRNSYFHRSIAKMLLVLFSLLDFHTHQLNMWHLVVSNFLWTIR